MKMVEKKGYRLSIVIPHHNELSLLKKLISTIPNNDDIQIIVVDDYSTDINKEEYRKLAKLYNSDRFLFLENESSIHSAGRARNIALNYVGGEWILFADADDLFVEGFYETVKEYFDTQYDIIYFEPISLILETCQEGTRHVLYKKIVNNYVSNPNTYTEIQLRTRFHVPWSKLIRAGLLVDNNIKFDETPVANDKFFSTKIGYYANCIYASNQVIYCVTRNTRSLTTRLDYETFKVRTSVDIEVFNFLKANMPAKKFNQMDNFVAYECLFTIIRRKYGLGAFVHYFIMFFKNRMFTFHLRWLRKENLDIFIKKVRDEKISTRISK